MSETVRVYPSTTLAPTEYVPGVGIDGAELPRAEAEQLHDLGLVRYTRPTEAAIATTPPAPAESGDANATTPAKPAKKTEG